MSCQMSLAQLEHNKILLIILTCQYCTKLGYCGLLKGEFVCSNAGAPWVGDEGWICIFPEGKGFCTLQGDTVFAAHQPDTQLC